MTVLMCACSSDPGEDPPVVIDPETISLHGSCEPRSRLGGFDLTEADGSWSVSGQVRSATIPFAVLDEVTSSGQCTLYRRGPLDCEPACDPGLVCDFDGSCIPFPPAQDVGTVTIVGLNRSVVMQPADPGCLYFDTQHPALSVPAGEGMRLTSTDGWAGELELFGIGVEPLEVTDSSWTISRSTGLDVSWTPPASPGRSHVFLQLNIDQHGISPLTIRCELDDTGHALVSVSFIDSLLDEGISGIPSGSLARRSVDSTLIEGGCVEFEVASVQRVTVVVEDVGP